MTDRALYTPENLALEEASVSNPPILLLPPPEGQYHQPPSTSSDLLRRFLDSEALRELEKDIHVNRITSLWHVGEVEGTPYNEDVHGEAARTPIRARRNQWGKHKEIKSSINRQLQEKSFLSYDWRVPLKLLKKYYRADRATPHKKVDLIRDSASKGYFNAVVDRIPEPEHWTKATFDRYVVDLARFKPPPAPVSRALGLGRRRSGCYTIPGIGDTLHSLFHRSEFRQFLTPEICNVAIFFLMRHRLVAKARSILLLMEHLSIRVPVATLNIFLKAAASQKDLHTFSWLLTIMIKRGHHPNEGTWVLFVQCLDLIAVKRLIIREMADLGILNIRGIRMRMMISTAKDDIIGFLASGGDPKDFLYQMRLKHGPDWMSPWTGNIILNEVSKRVSLAAGLDILEPLKQHGFTPTAITLKTSLYMTLRRGSLPLTAYVLQIFATKYKLTPDREDYQRLFNYAWKWGYLNVIRVIWIAASLNSSVTSQMLQKVLYSLRLNALQYKPADYAPARPTRVPRKGFRVFDFLMGIFVVGLPPLQYHGRNQGWRAAIDCIRMAKKAKMKFTLSFNLREAHKVDLEWNVNKGEDLRRKLAHRYPILLVTDRPHQSRVYYQTSKGG